MCPKSSPTLTRLTWAKSFHVAFLGFFVVYVAAAVVWLTAGVTPAVVNALPSLHNLLHGWGNGEQIVYVEISGWDGTFEQRQAWSPWGQHMREMTLRADTPVVIEFQNSETNESHNLSIYEDATATVPLFRGRVLPGPGADGDPSPRTVYRFTAPSTGTYYFRCDVEPAMNGTVRVVSGESVLASPTLAKIADGLARAAHISESPPVVAIQYLSLIHI